MPTINEAWKHLIYHQKHQIMDRNNLQPHDTLFLSTLGIILKLNTVRKHFWKKYSIFESKGKSSWINTKWQWWIQGLSSYANDEVAFPSYEMLHRLKRYFYIIKQFMHISPRTSMRQAPRDFPREFLVLKHVVCG